MDLSRRLIGMIYNYMKLLITEIKGCGECAYFTYDYYNLYCNYNGDMKIKVYPPHTPFEVDCPLPQVENSDKKFLMAEISSCDQCKHSKNSDYCQHKHRRQSNRFIIDESIIQSWCLLPTITPDPEKT